MTQGIRLLLVLLCSAASTVASDSDAGVAAFHAGRYSEALHLLTRAAKTEPSETNAAFLGLTQAAVGNCRDGLPSLAASYKDATLRKLAGVAAVRCYETVGERARSFATLAQIESEFPDDPDVLYTAAKLHMNAFNATTLAMFEHTPSSYRVHQLSAEIFEVQSRFADASAEYRKAIAANPTAPGLHYGLGRALLLASHAPEAVAQAKAEFEAELKLSPEDAPAEYQLAQIAQVGGDRASTRVHLERALHLAPDFVQALVTLGKIETQERHWPRAIELLQHATRLESQNEAAHYALLTAYRSSGQMAKAKEEKAILDRLQKPADGEFNHFLKQLGETKEQP